MTKRKNSYFHLFLRETGIENGIGGIYFIQNAIGYINIGNSQNIYTRLSHYQSHNPLPCWLVGYIQTTNYSYEKEQHSLWEIFNVTGEWYAPVRSLISYIRSFCDGEGSVIYGASSYEELADVQNYHSLDTKRNKRSDDEYPQGREPAYLSSYFIIEEPDE